MSTAQVIAAIPKMSEGERLQLRQNAGRKRFDGTDVQQAAAAEVIDALDRFEAESRRQMRERIQSMSEAERLKEAFRVHPPSETDAKVIRALLDNPGSTSLELSAASGWRGNAWHLHFGTMCYNRELYLWPAEKSSTHDAKFYSGILATYDERSSTFTMKPDIATAFGEIGFRT
jgi:hypothetical protein